MVEKLLDCLCKGSAETMGHFLSSLEASGQQHIAEVLLREYLISDVKKHFILMKCCVNHYQPITVFTGLSVVYKENHL